MATNGYTVEEGNRLNNFAIEPKVYVDDTQRFGFNAYAEQLNGRLAMIGFVSAIAFEALTGHGIITWLTSL
ncbi:MAG: chlorophyll a/b-binding protein [Spirulina sp.]